MLNISKQYIYWSGLLYPFQRILSTQGLNLGHLHCRQVLYHLSHQGMDMSLRKFGEMVRTGKPGELRSMGSRRVQHDLVRLSNNNMKLNIRILYGPAMPCLVQEPFVHVDQESI